MNPMLICLRYEWYRHSKVLVVATLRWASSIDMYLVEVSQVKICVYNMYMQLFVGIILPRGSMFDVSLKDTLVFVDRSLLFSYIKLPRCVCACMTMLVRFIIYVLGFSHPYASHPLCKHFVVVVHQYITGRFHHVHISRRTMSLPQECNANENPAYRGECCSVPRRWHCST